MNSSYNTRRRGLTLISLLIVILVIGILATMMMYSSSEAVATAKAAKILANLHLLRRAAIAWYADNRDKVRPNGMVKIDGKEQPIQQFSDKELKLGSYLSNLGGAGINVNEFTAKPNNNTGNIDTYLQKGCYRIFDGGTEVSSDKKTKTAYHRNVWYVGYRFLDGEEKVKEKIKGRLKSAGVEFGTADAHINTYENDDHFAAVWMRVL